MSDTPQETQWYIARDGQQHGPLSEPEIQLFVTGGHLKPTDLVWRPGFSDWKPAREVFEPKSAEPVQAPKPTNAPSTTSGHVASGRSQSANVSESITQPSSSSTPSTEKLSAHRPVNPAEGSSEPSTVGGRFQAADGRGSSSVRPSSTSPAAGSSNAGLGTSSTGTHGAADKHRAPAPNDLELKAQSGGLGDHSVFNAGRGSPGGNAAGQGDNRPATAGRSLRSALNTAGNAAGSSNEGVAWEQNQVLNPHSQQPTGGRGPNQMPAHQHVGELGSQSGGNVRPSQQQPIQQSQHGRGKQPNPGYLEPDVADASVYDGYGNPPKKSIVATVIPMMAAIIFVGGLSYLGYVNRAQLGDIAGSMMGSPSANSAGKPPPVVAAAKTTKTAALTPEQSAQSNSAGSEGGAGAPVAAATLSSLDTQFQKSALWSLLKADYPAWYDARLKQVLDMNAAGDDPDVTKSLLAEIVTLRRKHAKKALSASTDKLLVVATAFLSNLKRLGEHSTEACYMFISKGELSPTVFELMSKKNMLPALEMQATAIFKAISDGRKVPVKRERASRGDYDLLSKQLLSMGWTTQDLQLFANPTALSNATPTKVCQMVQDWFGAHIAIPDKVVQERLLFETLRPVVAG